jgi:hypothetical protein
MNDIKQIIKEQIKEAAATLARLEKALAALEGTKPAPKAKASATPSAPPAGSPTRSGKTENAPDAILALLKKYADDGSVGGLGTEAIANKTGVALGQVRTTCSRLAREGRIATRKEGKTAFYMISKAESEAMTTAPDFDDSPIEASN